jgi:hypothetical protein
VRNPYAVVGAGVTVAAAVLVVAISLMSGEDRAQLLFETARAAISLFPLVFVTVVVADLVRRRDADKARREERQRAREAFRLRAIAAYGESKATRRTLRGAGLRPDSGITLGVAQLAALDEQMGSLTRAQLSFEQLAREMASESAPFDHRDRIREPLRTIEQYLSSVIRDWEAGRPLLREGDSAEALAQWTTFSAFVAAKDETRPDTDPTRAFAALEGVVLAEIRDAAP